MDATEISFGILFLLQISTGVSVNGFLLLFYTHMVSTSQKFSSSDLILSHLALANTIALLTLGIPETMSVCGLRNFLNNVGCKILFYFYRVGRGLAICTTCLLSVFQAITISPGTARWAGAKVKLYKCILPSCILFWILNMLVEFDRVMNMTGPQNSSSLQSPMDYKYCSRLSLSAVTTLVYAVALSLQDLVFVGLMSTASGYMVFVLHRHHRRVQHLHKPSNSPRVMPEVIAAKRVIALVTLFVLLYGRQSVMLNIIMNMKEKSPLLLNSHMVFAHTFAALSPCLVIHSDRRMRMFWKRESAASNIDSSS
ncbi:vomeronasal 1 receptor ornAnaV1R3031 isoform X1 [Ornithorhynchus anatinus]|uniref:Vomeronasal type-1 receptor n=1 Tax=Ornithorhynchus anatinus TaxID=9258 RepID=A0A6I8NFL7_ORNAN|nr:vomeronasal 1 receptor ornAnaV1R3031 [Ornithorhynchus anatinus]XP_028913109.1 vomeronasal 1 receptor ornAnaV1R3031 isoform X1 [Ornithorhynchus anatinus]